MELRSGERKGRPSEEEEGGTRGGAGPFERGGVRWWWVGVTVTYYCLGVLSVIFVPKVYFIINGEINRYAQVTLKQAWTCKTFSSISESLFKYRIEKLPQGPRKRHPIL